jgi:hypothetical protein
MAKIVADPGCDIDTLSDCCWALYHLSQNRNNSRAIAMTPGLCERLTVILDFPSDQIIMPIIRIMGNLLSSIINYHLGEQEIVAELVKYDILTPFERLLSHIKKLIRK